MHPRTAQFIEHVRRKAEANGIAFNLANSVVVDVGHGIMSSGYYESSAELAVGVAKPERDWLPVLAHEFCHLEQDLAQCSEWCDSDVGNIDSSELLDMWLEGKNFSDRKLLEALHKTKVCELDCERRTVELLKRWKFKGISAARYAQRAGCYMQFHNYILIRRKWYPKGRPPYRCKAVQARMPTNLDGDYAEISPEVVLLFDRYFGYGGAR